MSRRSLLLTRHGLIWLMLGKPSLLLRRQWLLIEVAKSTLLLRLRRCILLLL